MRERDALILAEDEDRPIPFAPDLAVEGVVPGFTFGVADLFA